MSGLDGMAESPERRSDLLADRPAAARPLFDRAHGYGVAHDLERMRAGMAPSPRPPRVRAPTSLRRGGLLASVRRRWASSDNRPADVWHRLRCRAGHHEFSGGELMQLGSRFVLIERRCTWCDAEPSL